MCSVFSANYYLLHVYIQAVCMHWRNGSEILPQPSLS